jgi:hypothetical protein
MKTHTIRRSLLSGVLLAGVAGTLIGTTRPVRADNLTSSALTSVTDEASATRPYFWIEVAREVVAMTNAQHASGYIISQHHCFVDASGSLGTAGAAALDALSFRALD